jgi:hypothetical protein
VDEKNASFARLRWMRRGLPGYWNFEADDILSRIYFINARPEREEGFATHASQGSRVRFGIFRR